MHQHRGPHRDEPPRVRCPDPQPPQNTPDPLIPPPLPPPVPVEGVPMQHHPPTLPHPGTHSPEAAGKPWWGGEPPFGTLSGELLPGGRPTGPQLSATRYPHLLARAPECPHRCWGGSSQPLPPPYSLPRGLRGRSGSSEAGERLCPHCVPPPCRERRNGAPGAGSLLQFYYCMIFKNKGRERPQHRTRGAGEDGRGGGRGGGRCPALDAARPRPNKIKKKTKTKKTNKKKERGIRESPVCNTESWEQLL